jgi:hypothetical protein
MTPREALSQIPAPLWGLWAPILVAFLSRVGSLRGVERYKIGLAA